MHIAMYHAERRGNKFHHQFNYACDAVINDRLRKAGFKCPKEGIHLKVGFNQTEEDIYEELLKKLPNYEFENDSHIFWDISQGNLSQAQIPTKDLAKIVAKSLKIQFPDYGLTNNVDTQYFNSSLIPDGVDWKHVTEDFINSTQYNDGLDWSKRSSMSKMLFRQIGNKAPYLPKIQNHSIGKIAIVVDTSGSTFGFLDLFHNTVLNIITSLGLTALIICCDDRVQNTFELTPQTLDLIKTSYTGCGGTEFSPPFKWILDNEITIDGLIYLTDGYGECKIPEPEYPVLWVSTDNINFANFGKFIKIHKK